MEQDSNFACNSDMVVSGNDSRNILLRNVSTTQRKKARLTIMALM